MREKIHVECPEAQTVTIVAEASHRQLQEDAGESAQDFTENDDRELGPDECFYHSLTCEV